MNPTFSPEQLAFRSLLGDLLRKRGGVQRARSVDAEGSGCDLPLFSELLALGAGDLPTEQDRGILFEEAGRHLVAGPLCTTLGYALPLLEAAAPDSELLGDTRAGRAIPVVGFGPLTVWDADAATHILFEENGELTVASRQECLLVDLASFDPGRRLARVREVGKRRSLGLLRPDADHRSRWAVATACELIGVAQACLDMAVTYANGREQFGRPIGSFQAVSHQCADMYILIEAARGHAYYAAWAVQDHEPCAGLAAAQAIACAGEAALECAERNIQIHGAMGFTWEHDAHLFLRRARSAITLSTMVQDPADRIADLLGL
jgi:hypothetical protein